MDDDSPCHSVKRLRSTFKFDKIIVFSNVYGIVIYRMSQNFEQCDMICTCFANISFQVRFYDSLMPLHTRQVQQARLQAVHED